MSLFLAEVLPGWPPNFGGFRSVLTGPFVRKLCPLHLGASWNSTSACSGLAVVPGTKRLIDASLIGEPCLQSGNSDEGFRNSFLHLPLRAEPQHSTHRHPSTAQPLVILLMTSVPASERTLEMGTKDLKGAGASVNISRR